MNKMKKNESDNAAAELWFPESDKAGLVKRTINATVRAGDRTEQTADPKGGYGRGRFVRVKIQLSNRQFDDWQTIVAVQTADKTTLGRIKDEDLAGTPLKRKTKTELRARLRDAYGRDFGDGDIVTIVRFECKDNLRSAEDLVRVGALAFAKEPKDNHEHLNFRHYTLPLVEHDYPALTPVMWNAAYRTFDLLIGNVMLVGQPAAACHILDVLRRDEKYLGGGSGVGFKDEVVACLDELTSAARAIGAVNFIAKTSAGKLKGFNTDGLGYVQGLESAFRKRNENLTGKRAVVLGAGGAGNAVAFALAEKGMRLMILNRTVEKAEKLAAEINRHFGGGTAQFGNEEQIANEVGNADLVVNVSTKGAAGPLEQYSALAPARLPATAENIRENQTAAAAILRLIPKRALVSDIVLRQGLTPILGAAKTAGYEILDGKPMVINQGIEAFWLLHGEELKAKGVSKERLAEVMSQAAMT